MYDELPVRGPDRKIDMVSYSGIRLPGSWYFILLYYIYYSDLDIFLFPIQTCGRSKHLKQFYTQFISNYLPYLGSLFWRLPMRSVSPCPQLERERHHGDGNIFQWCLCVWTRFFFASHGESILKIVPKRLNGICLSCHSTSPWPQGIFFLFVVMSFFFVFPISWGLNLFSETPPPAEFTIHQDPPGSLVSPHDFSCPILQSYILCCQYWKKKPVVRGRTIPLQ